MSEDEYTHRQYWDRKENWIDFELWKAIKQIKEENEKLYEKTFRINEKVTKNNKNRD